MKPLARSIALVALPLLALAACSSEVVTSGSGGAGGDAAGGAGGAVGSSSVTTGSTATTSGTTTGGGTPCEQGCTKIEMCTGFTCDQAGVDCSDPQFDCIGLCVLDASCADIIALAQGNGPPELQACLQACQGGGQGGGMQGGNCGQCVFQANCADGCMNDPACQQWGQCALNCNTPDCYADCNTQHPDAAMQYEAIYACACTSCESDCSATMDPCNQGATGAGGGMSSSSTSGAGGAMP